MTITRWRPNRGMTLRDAFQQLVEDAFSEGFPSGLSSITNSTFPVDIRETPDSIEIDASLPGADPKDIDVTATSNTVQIKAEIRKRQEERRGQLLREEITEGTFQRAFTLPNEVDPNKVTAKFDNGVLKLALPKSEATKPKRVQIQGVGVSDVKIGNGQRRDADEKMPVGAR